MYLLQPPLKCPPVFCPAVTQITFVCLLKYGYYFLYSPDIWDIALQTMDVKHQAARVALSCNFEQQCMRCLFQKDLQNSLSVCHHAGCANHPQNDSL